MLANFQMFGLLNLIHVRTVGVCFVHVLYINWNLLYYVLSLFKHILLEGEIMNFIRATTS